MPVPKVSICVGTHARDAWLPWVRWNYERQTYPNRELIVVASNTHDDSLAVFDDMPDVSIVRLGDYPAGFCGVKRQHAVNVATGSLLTFWDDDDWQAPERTYKLVQAYQANTTRILGWHHGWFLNAQTCQTSAYVGGGKIIPVVNMLVERQLILDHPFLEVQQCPDEEWTGKLLKTGQKIKVLPHDGYPHSLWVVHGKNFMQNRAYRWREHAGLLPPEEWALLRAQLSSVLHRRKIDLSTSES